MSTTTVPSAILTPGAYFVLNAWQINQEILRCNNEQRMREYLLEVFTWGEFEDGQSWIGEWFARTRNLVGLRVLVEHCNLQITPELREAYGYLYEHPYANLGKKVEVHRRISQDDILYDDDATRTASVHEFHGRWTEADMYLCDCPEDFREYLTSVVV